NIAIGTLAAHSSTTLTATYVVTQADVDAGQVLDTVRADSDQTDEVQDSVTVTIIQNPVLELDKQLQGNADEDQSGSVSVGDTLTYSFLVSNSGNVTLTNVTLVDPLTGSNISIGTLAAHSSTTL